MSYCLKYTVVLFIGVILCVSDGSASSADVAGRSRREAGSINMIELFMKINSLIENCKKKNPPAVSNTTNAIVQFVENHDLECLINGAIKIYQDMSPNTNKTRSKREADNFIGQLIQLMDDTEKCKKPDPTPTTNSTNFIQDLMNNYDMGCMIKAVINFAKTIMRKDDSSGRSKRSVQISDLTCFAMKIFQDEHKISDAIKAFSPKSRTKRAAPIKKICDDFGTLLDTVLTFVVDFAPTPSNGTASA